jgi:U3 small nucleolar RNA-associated protein 14
MKTSHRKFKTSYIELILHSGENESESESENEGESEGEKDEDDEIESKQHRNRLSIDTKTDDAKSKDVLNRLRFIKLKS